MSIFSQP